MDIEKFLAIRPIPDWSMEPNLYIVLQDGGVKQPDGSFRQNRAHRCGAAGLHLYKDADLPLRLGKYAKHWIAGSPIPVHWVL